MANILLVEDSLTYANSAMKYLASNRHEVTLAADYSRAIENLTNLKFDGLITDCFFPEIIGSGKTDLGKELVERMAKSDPSERRMVRGLEIIGKYVDLEDQDMKKYARSFINNCQTEDISQSPVVKALAVVSGPGQYKEGATHIAKNTLGQARVYDEHSTRDFYGALRNAMEKSEANQPLGILLGEKADELKLPFILATSTYHHDILTQPIQNYVTSKGWSLVDCNPNKEEGKASPEFWKGAVSRLEEKLK